MATSWPKALGIFGGAETFSRRVQELTNGRFVITPFVAGELVPGLQVLDAVQAGTVECGHTASYYYIGKNAALAFATTVPFGLTAQQQNAWLYHGGGLEALQKLYADFNVVNFPAGNSGAQMGGWFKREIKSVSDLILRRSCRQRKRLLPICYLKVLPRMRLLSRLTSNGVRFAPRFTGGMRSMS